MIQWHCMLYLLNTVVVGFITYHIAINWMWHTSSVQLYMLLFSQLLLMFTAHSCVIIIDRLITWLNTRFVLCLTFPPHLITNSLWLLDARHFWSLNLRCFFTKYVILSRFKRWKLGHLFYSTKSFNFVCVSVYTTKKNTTILSIPSNFVNYFLWTTQHFEI